MMIRNTTTIFLCVLIAACSGGDESPSFIAAVDNSGVMDDPSLSPVVTVPPAVENGSPDVEGGDYYTSSNNSAILNGMVVGVNTTMNESIRKAIPFTTEGEVSSVSLLNIYTLDNGDDIISTLTNTSNEPICLPRIDITFIDDTGGQGEATIITAGSYQRQQNGPDNALLAPSCLLPGEVVYATGFIGVGANRANIVSAVVEEIEHFPSSLLNVPGHSMFTVPAVEEILPISYEVVIEDERSQTIEVLFSNQSNETFDAENNVFSFEIVILDEDGLPLGVAGGARKTGRGENFEDLPPVIPGDEYIGVLSTDFKGSATSIRVISSFLSIEAAIE